MTSQCWPLVCLLAQAPSCNRGGCLLSQHAAVQGACSSDNCPYLHVNHGASAPTCPAFLRGYCPDGAACTRKHVTSKMIREISAARSPHPTKRRQVSWVHVKARSYAFSVNDAFSGLRCCMSSGDIHVPALIHVQDTAAALPDHAHVLLSQLCLMWVG